MAPPTSYATFIAAVAALNITGVTRAYTEPPSRISAADMPLSFPRLPSGTHAIVTLDGYSDAWPTLRCELVILIHPMQLETDDVKFADTLTYMDNATATLRNASLASAPVRWEIRSETVFISSSLYHAVIIEIETKG